jgi:hypothetical protein
VQVRSGGAMGYGEHRQFGRRESRIAARVALPRNVQMPCMIENLSDGGALLTFEEPAPTAASFRLIVEGTSFNLLCEPRHAQGNRLGVKFARLAEDIALNRHFQRTTVAPEAGERAEGERATHEGGVAPSVRALRSRFTAAIQTRAPDLTNATEASGEQRMAAGYLPLLSAGVPVAGGGVSRRPARLVRALPDHGEG